MPTAPGASITIGLLPPLDPALNTVVSFQCFIIGAKMIADHLKS